MKEYHKIQTVYKRDPKTNFRTLLTGDYSMCEFEFLEDNEWVFTEKVDGTNIRVMFDGEKVTFGGKTDRAQIPAELVAELDSMFKEDAALRIFKEKFPDGVCLYGEGYGKGIQKGGCYSAYQTFVLFDVKVGPWWLQRHNVEDTAAAFGIAVVPIIGGGTLDDMVELTRKGFTSTWGDFMAEGIVARPAVELCTRGGKRVITKLKYKDFPR